MKCGVCRAANPRSYCGACIRDRICQHDWLVDATNTVRRGDAAQKVEWTSMRVQQLYEYQSRRLQARRQRVTALRDRIQVREQQIAAAKQLHSEMLDQTASQRERVHQHEQGAMQLLEKSAQEATKAFNKSAGQCQRAHAMLRQDRGILAEALCGVVGLQLRLPANDDVFSSMDGQARLFGLPWPGSDDWAKYPNEYINACVNHCIHVFSVLTHYFHMRLPFHILKRGSGLFIRPNWRLVDVDEAALSIDDSNRGSFVVGLSMLLYDIAFMCHLQGVRVPIEQITDVVENLRQAVLALSHRENEARIRLPFTLDVYSVVQEIMKMYSAPGDTEPDATLRDQVHNVLRQLHLCDDAVDSVDYDDENWAII
ncbi:hypothetical protein COEREDRAFT_80756 [Coemansia reversa NRRL 1564]|uniref:Autophagy-related protein 14 n=1 Tax=Coemansia reversa (strain ATCC 12441 / NRRL 1564) TaxID=763665 RepID=A0A2G5BDE8_COERN|nr:hypothetical protein COEREDRAFT_80756 [Coemansia reversa NRRL 1564]|eukprot:PIA17040.1 hypothetical protein COEREDRAFT_80756 [Coemansia reversa NRRL 1564]